MAYKTAAEALKAYGYVENPAGTFTLYAGNKPKSQKWVRVTDGFLRFETGPDIHTTPASEGGASHPHQMPHSREEDGSWNWVYSDDEVNKIYSAAVEALSN